MHQTPPLPTVSSTTCTCNVVSSIVYRWRDRLCWYLWKHSSSRCCQVWPGVTDQHSIVKWCQQVQVSPSGPEADCFIVKFELQSDTNTFPVTDCNLIMMAQKLTHWKNTEWWTVNAHIDLLIFSWCPKKEDWWDASVAFSSIVRISRLLPKVTV